MKAYTFVAAALLVAPAVSSPAEQAPAKQYVKVPLTPPEDWIAGSTLFPGNVIAGYHADLKQYTAATWSAHVLAQCKTFSACDSTIAYSAINTGTPKTRNWIGYVFRGGPTTEKNYQRLNGVQDSSAYTVKGGK